MEWKVSFYRMNAFYISLLKMKSSIAFGTVYIFGNFYNLKVQISTGSSFYFKHLEQ
jgi:hypothetical protein